MLGISIGEAIVIYNLLRNDAIRKIMTEAEYDLLGRLGEQIAEYQSKNPT